MRLLPLALPPLLFLTACTWVPSAEVTGVRLDQTGADGSRVVATVRLKNETSTPMPMVSMYYRLTVEGAPDFRIDDQPFKTVPTVDAQGGVQTVELPAGFPGAASLAGKKVTLRGVFTFRPDTDWRRLKTELGMPLPTRSFEFEGVLEGPPASLPQKPPQSAAQPAAQTPPQTPPKTP